MARQNLCVILGLALMTMGAWRNAFGDETVATGGAASAKVEAAATEKSEDSAAAKKEVATAKPDADENATTKPEKKDAVDLFGGVNDGKLDLTFVARSSKEARVIITNKTKQPMTIRLPEAFAGVPVVAQRAGGGGGGNQFGGGGGNQFGGGGGINQSIGGGFGGGGIGGGGFGGGGIGGGGGGFFSIAPEQTARLEVAVVCLDHGLRDPSSSKQYQMVPIESHVKRPAVVELIKAFGRGELQHGAAQAAAWHLNNDIPFAALAAKLQGTERSIVRPPYFSGQEIQAAMAYAGEAARRGQIAEMQRLSGQGETNLVSSSEALSTAPDSAPKSAASADDEKETDAAATKQRARRTRPTTSRSSEKSSASATKSDAATQP